MRTGRWSPKRILGVVAGLMLVGVIVWVVVATLAVDSLHSTKATSGVPTREVTEAVKELARERQLHATTVRCRQVASNAWRCRVRLADGREVPAHGTWNPRRKVLGVGMNQAE
jgi:hypothetical protein